MSLIDGTAISREILAEIARSVQVLKVSFGVTPGLAVVLVGDNPASQSYVRGKNKAAREIGIDSRQYTLPGDTRQGELLKLIETLNRDSTVHGILVQLPLPEGLDERSAIMAISPDKDVDGLHPVNLGKLLRGEDGPRPCTPLGIQRLLVRAGITIAGSHIVVVGRSNLVGKPIAAILSQKGRDAHATVTLCHSKTTDLGRFTRQADILIAAIGRPCMITRDMVRDGAVVIDVGINRVPDPSISKGYRIVGDVDFEKVAPKCAAITPVPGGVGAMTVTMLLHNTVEAARKAVGG